LAKKSNRLRPKGGAPDSGERGGKGRKLKKEGKRRGTLKGDRERGKAAYPVNYGTRDDHQPKRKKGHPRQRARKGAGGKRKRTRGQEKEKRISMGEAAPTEEPGLGKLKRETQGNTPLGKNPPTEPGEKDGCGGGGGGVNGKRLLPARGGIKKGL